jgi:catechol 2,3-dioxygenase-like lactoylglutathione lyase family enzyme
MVEPGVGSIRVARPSRDLDAGLAFYVDGLGLARMGGFEGHAGYDGAFVGPVGGGAAAPWHLELTRHASGRPEPSPTPEDLLVLYLPAGDVAAAKARLAAAGYAAVEHENPYWSSVGAVVVPDPDGYLLVLCPVEAGPYAGGR